MHAPSHARLLTRLSCSFAISFTGSRTPFNIRHTEVVSSTTFTALPLGGSAAPDTCKLVMRQLELQLPGILHRVSSQGPGHPFSIRHTEAVSSTTSTALPLGGSAAPDTCTIQPMLQLQDILHRVPDTPSASGA